MGILLSTEQTELLKGKVGQLIEGRVRVINQASVLLAPTGAWGECHEQERLKGTNYSQQVSEDLMAQEKQDSGVENNPQEGKDSDSASSSSLSEPVSQLSG